MYKIIVMPWWDCGGSIAVLFEQAGEMAGLARVDGVDLQSGLAPTREATAEPNPSSCIESAYMDAKEPARSGMPDERWSRSWVTCTHTLNNIFAT